MEGWEGVRQEKTKEEEGSSREGWREEEDKALYHDSLERVCLRQTPSRSPDNQGAALLALPCHHSVSCRLCRASQKISVHLDALLLHLLHLRPSFR